MNQQFCAYAVLVVVLLGVPACSSSEPAEAQPDEAGLSFGDAHALIQAFVSEIEASRDRLSSAAVLTETGQPAVYLRKVVRSASGRVHPTLPSLIDDGLANALFKSGVLAIVSLDVMGDLAGERAASERDSGEALPYEPLVPTLQIAGKLFEGPAGRMQLELELTDVISREVLVRVVGP